MSQPVERNFMSRLRKSLLALALTSLCAWAWATDAPPDYSRYTQGVFLSYVNVDGGPIHAPPKLLISFGGEQRPAVMDTGSTGIVVSADQIPHWDTLPKTPGKIIYSSSGRVMNGVWVTTPVIIRGGNGAMVRTTPIPVLAVTEITCLANARSCRPQVDPAGVSMIGVGFGREQDVQSQSTPDHNPFINIAGDSRPRRRGYIVTHDGVHIGLTRVNTRGPFRFTKLKPYPGIPGEWQGQQVCIRISLLNGDQCGRALVDTGVTGMFLRFAGSSPGSMTQLPPNTSLTITFLPGTDGRAAASYGFVVDGPKSELAPSKITLIRRSDKTFVNTGVNLLNGFDILYDADGGYTGFRPVQPIEY